MKREMGILMAAGLGTRMLPLTQTIPKPLLKVRGVALIETVITALQKRNIEKIYIVVGYRKEQFSYLCKKYPEVELIENREYLTKNNISSIAAMRDILGSADCFVCEADLWVKDQTVFQKAGERSGYFGKMVSGYSGDWVFETSNQTITAIHMGGTDCYNMVGLSYWKREDAAIIREAVKEWYLRPGHEDMFWDEVVDQVAGRIRPAVIEVDAGDVIEVDTAEELEVLNY